MAVLFPNPNRAILSPTDPSQLLQGFLNIEQSENVTNGKLTQANLTSYGQKRFIAADPNSNVASYLTQNFAKIAANDGDSTSISTNDLVQLRQGLPTPPPAPTNPPIQPPYQNNESFSMILNFLKTLLSMMSNMFKF